MRITFLINHDLPALLALNYLLPSLSAHSTSIFYTQKKIRKQPSPKLAELAAFDAEQVHRSLGLIGFDELGAQPLNNINTTDYERYIQSKPDLVISIRHMSILKSRVINIPNLGVINLHSGALPAYQGIMATFWALFNHEPNLGTSLHFIENSGIDTGSVISKTSVLANYQQSYLWNVLSLYQSGCENVALAIKQLDHGKPLTVEPQSGPANYFSFPKTLDLEQSPVPLFKLSDRAGAFI